MIPKQDIPAGAAETGTGDEETLCAVCLIEVIIQTLYQKFPISATPSDTIGTIKHKVAKKVGSDVEAIKALLYKGQLQDSLTLSDHGISNGMTIQLLINVGYKPAMKEGQIFVETFSGKTITLNVKSTDTIEGVKAQIQDKLVGYEKAVASKQMLVLGYTCLDDDKTLRDYKVHNEATLRLVPKKGGVYKVHTEATLRLVPITKEQQQEEAPVVKHHDQKELAKMLEEVKLETRTSDKQPCCSIL